MIRKVKKQANRENLKSELHAILDEFNLNAEVAVKNSQISISEFDELRKAFKYTTKKIEKIGDK